MDPRPPSHFSHCKSYPNELPGMLNPMNFHHQQFPQHLSFSHPSYAMNFPHQQFPQPHLYPQNVHYVVVQPQYAPFSLPQPPHPPVGITPTRPPPPAGVMPSLAVALPRPPPAGAMPFMTVPGPAGVMPFMTVPGPAGVMPFMTVPDSGTPHSVTGPDEQDTVSGDNDENDPDKAAKRLMWMEEEDLRLISAWLNCPKLKDLKRKEVCWGYVTQAYNKSTPSDRRREANHLKSHWSKTNKKIAQFYNCWCRVKEKYAMVQSDCMQLMDQTWAMYYEEAREMYLEEAKHHFAFSHFWKAVWDQPKWLRYISKRTKLSESGDCTSSSEDDEDAAEKEASQQGCMTANKQDAQGKTSSHSLVMQEATQCAVDPQDLLKDNQKQMTELQLQHESAVRVDMPENKIHPQGCNTVEHARTVNGDVPGQETTQRGCMVAMGKRKRKGNLSSSPMEVQEDIKRAMDLQAMLQKDREKMSEVQLRLSKEKLELARLKQLEAKDKKETMLYEKYTELLTADTQGFNEFQKEEYEKAVKHMGEMLFGKDAK